MVAIHGEPQAAVDSLSSPIAEIHTESPLKISANCSFPQPRDLHCREIGPAGEFQALDFVLSCDGRKRSGQAVTFLVIAWAVLIKEYNLSKTLQLTVTVDDEFKWQIPFEPHPASSVDSVVQYIAARLVRPANPIKPKGQLSDDCNTNSYLTLSILGTQYQPDETPEDVRVHAHEALRLSCWPQTESTMRGRVLYDSSKCMDEQAQRFLNQYIHITRQLMRHDHTVPLRDIELICDHDKALMMQWNSAKIAVSRDRLHESFQARALEHPTKIAAVTTEGHLSYAQLDEFSSILAAALVRRGVGRDSIVPILFEKSLWAIVTILGVLKTGAASTSICVSHPDLYIAKVVDQTGSALLLTSATQYDRLADLECVERMIVSESTLNSLPQPPSRWQIPPGDPEDVACVLFTSGSTGQPKGVPLSHRAIGSTMDHHGRATGICGPPKTLQFSSYAFDMAIYEIFHALVRGGTICTPSEEERLHDLPEFVAKHQTTWAFITPTVLRTYSPSDFPTMETIVVGGEAVGTDLVQAWGNRLYNGFGPAEVSICVATRMDPKCWVNGTIGRPVGCIGWIVNPNDVDILTPIGGIGELVVEGPIVAHGYLHEPEKTREAFISPPCWRSTFPIPSRGDFFRTSDLVQYNYDGSMRYLSRRDNVRKINGQRIDIENIEVTLRQMEPNLDISVDVMATPGQKQERVIAFVAERRGQPDKFDMEWAQGSSTHAKMRVYGRGDAIREAMSSRLPRYMIPAFLIELPVLPTTATSKVDRKRLASMLTEQLHSDNLKLLKSAKMISTSQRRALSTIEKQLASLVQETLALEATDVDIDSAFVQLGGDSLAAVKLVSLARKAGLSFKTIDLLRHDMNLADLAEKAEKWGSLPSVNPRCAVVKPFSMLPTNEHDCAEILKTARAQCGVEVEAIHDIYPCTPIQEGLFSAAASSSGAYIDRFMLTLSPDVDKSRLLRAWNTVIQSSDILRTRIIQTSIGAYQVVTDYEELPVQSYNSTEQYLSVDVTREMGPGASLIVLSLIVPDLDSGIENSTRRTATSHSQLVVTIHHAVYDGWSWQMILQDVETAYRGDSLSPRSFSEFVQFLQGRDIIAEQDFWRSYYRDLNAGAFPEGPNNDHAPQPSIRLAYRYQSLPTAQPEMTASVLSVTKASTVTPSTRIHLAWSILISLYTHSSDVVYGTISNGRLSPLPGIESIMGPTLTTIPFRHTVDQSMRVNQALLTIQENTQSTLTWEHAGLRSISRISPEARTACAFQTMVVIQPQKPELKSTIFQSMKERLGADGFVPGYSVILLCTPGEKNHSWDLELLLDEDSLSAAEGERLLHQFSHILSQIHEAQPLRINQLDLLCIADQIQLCEWNIPSPPRLDHTIHGIVKLQCLLRPQETAVCAWDGSFTYDEVQQISDSGAKYLRGLGIGAGTILPICLERSKWVPIALLSIMKTGAAFVLLDPGVPSDRNQSICARVGAQWVLTSSVCRKYCEDFAVNTFCFSDVITRADNIQPAYPEAHVDTSRHNDLLYVVFTSGSTGTPKGVEIEHGSYCSAMIAQREKLHIRTGTRVLQLSSYAFDSFAVEILTTLCGGGCVCIPSTEQLAGGIGPAIRQYQAEWMCATPSMLRLISPGEVPTLKTVVAVGETMLPSQLALWAPAVTLMCGYGPSECCTGATVQIISDVSVNPRNIGSGMGCIPWVVDQHDHNKLVPIGAVGELVLQGRIVGRGYLHEPEKTRAVYLDHTEWSQTMDSSSGERLYKTGDLVRFNHDGTCRFLGRKDYQVKLRGQRVNLMDVEHHLAGVLATQVNELIADVIQPRTNEIKGDAHPLLVAMIQTADEGMFDMSKEVQGVERSMFVPSSTRFAQLVSQVEQQLSSVLPAVMIPSLWLIARQMPLTISGKVDRRQVRAAAASLTSDALLTLGCTGAESGDNTLSLTEITATKVSEVVAEVLHSRLKLDRERVVGKNVTLSRIGLDSIDMMSITQAISTHFNVRLPMKMLFRSGLTVRDVALMITGSSATKCLEREPPQTMDLWGEYQVLREKIRSICIQSRKPVHSIDQNVLREGSFPRLGRVLLTGGTGFLGSQILKSLLENSRVQSVTVLVRAASDKTAMRRIVEAAHGAGWWRESYRSRVCVWRGCLSKSRLGLSDDRWRMLCGLERPEDAFDSVIHNGARVHWGQDYHTLQPVNTGSTVDLMSALVQLARPVVFTYVSALQPSFATMDDDQSLAKALSNSDGYSQTKFMSELAIKEFQRYSVCKHLHVNIIRPGWIIGSTENGHANLGDYLWRVVGSAVTCGFVNSEEDPDSWIYISPVDLVAGLITCRSLDIDASRTAAAGHPDNSQSLQVTSITDGLAATDFWHAVSTAYQQIFGSPLQPCQGHNWLHRIKGSMMTTGDDHLLWPVYEFLESDNGRLGSSCANPIDLPATLRSLLFRSVIQNVQHLCSARAVDIETGRLMPAQPSLFRRAVS